jgi:rubrerythrin
VTYESADFSTPDKILVAALEREKAAHAFYSDLAKQTRIEMVRRLVEHLKDEEHKHVHMIEEMIARLNLGQGA